MSHNEFGYRSVHLVARLKSPRNRSIEYRALGEVVFEIQVRSILEHAWAEIEHEIGYKSAIAFPPEDARRLASIAGALEILDREFRQLRSVREKLIDCHAKRFSKKLGLNESLDAARLIAAIATRFPKAPQLSAGNERMLLQALEDIGVRTPQQVFEKLRGRRFAAELAEYAVRHSLAPERVAQQVVVMIAIALSSVTTIEEYFPELLDDPGIANLLSRLERKKG